MKHSHPNIEEIDISIMECYQELRAKNDEFLENYVLKNFGMTDTIHALYEKFWMILAQNDGSLGALEFALLMHDYQFYEVFEFDKFIGMLSGDDTDEVIFEHIAEGKVLVSYLPGDYNKVILVTRGTQVRDKAMGLCDVSH